jgi:hypothetical protein
MPVEIPDQSPARAHGASLFIAPRGPWRSADRSRCAADAPRDFAVDEQSLELVEERPSYSACSTGSSVVIPFHPNSFETAVVVSIRVGRNSRSRWISATSRKAVIDIAPTTRFE